MSNCFVSRQGRLAAHSFVYKCRCDLFPGELDALPPDRLRQNAHDHDVFALTKGRMHGSSFHAPVLCLPRHHVKLKELEKLANVLGALPGDYTKACNRLRDMVGWLSQNCVSDSPHPPDLRWLARLSPARGAVPRSSNVYYEHLPDSSWQLLARFHRLPRRG